MPPGKSITRWCGGTEKEPALKNHVAALILLFVCMSCTGELQLPEKGMPFADPDYGTTVVRITTNRQTAMRATASRMNTQRLTPTTATTPSSSFAAMTRTGICMMLQITGFCAT